MNPWDRCHTPEDHLLYFLDCQLATVEELELLKSPPKGRLDRHRGIARKMIQAARSHKLPVDEMSRVQDFEAKEKAR